MALVDLDVYEDLAITRNLAFSWSFQVTPMDLRGASARMVVDGIGTWLMSILVSRVGADALSTLTVEKTDVETGALTAGDYAYRVQVVFPDGSVWPFGHGKLTVN